MEYTKYLIIGNGIAGHSASLEIRKLDPEGRIVIISREPHNTYYRLKLTELIAHPGETEDIYLMTEEKAKESNIEILLSNGVTEIRPEEKLVVLENHRDFTYEKLLIATGSQPFIPPTEGQEKEDVISIRTIDDIMRLHRNFKDKEHIVVIGGGLLGLEAAWGLHESGKKVDVVEMAPWLLPRQLDEPSSAQLTARLGEAGIGIHTGTSVTRILGDETVTGVRLGTDEVIDCDGVLFNIGVRPDTALAKEAGIPTERGIIVDEKMRTRIEDIYAAGDCIEHGGMVFGLWTQSNAQGRVAGQNMAGGNAAYTNPKLFSNLKIGDIQIFSSGDVQGYDEVREYQETGDGFKKFFFLDGKPVGAILFGDIKDMAKVNKILDGDMAFEDYRTQNNP